MRLVSLSFFFLFSLLTSGQIDLEERISIRFESLSIDDALQELSNAAQIPFAYSHDIFSDNVIDIFFRETQIKSILSRILQNELVSYTLENQQLLFFIDSEPENIISGVVEDKLTGEKLIGATVFNREYKIGVSTNEYGFFSITLPRKLKNISVRYLGYDEASVTLLENQDRMSIGLSPISYDSEVVIIPEKILGYPTQNEDHIIQLSKKFNDISPSLAGESDYVRNSHLLPGINAANDGLGGINIRGGEDGQNLFLLDGVPIYIPYHLLGAYSVYNSSSIKSARILKGHFPAKYGGRISSIYDVWAKEGSKYNWKSQADVNLSMAKLLIEGPIKKGESSLLIAGRIAPRDFLFGSTFKRIYFQSQVNPVNSKFYDINTKLNFKISKKDHIHINFYRGYDSFNSEEPEEIEGVEEEDENELKFSWHNTVSSVKWNRHVSSKTFINTTATYSTYGYSYQSLNLFGIQNSTNSDFFFLNSTSANRDIGIRTDIDIIPNNSHTLKFGIGYSHRRFQPSTALLDEEDEETSTVETTVATLSELSTDQLYNASEIFVYAEDQVKLSHDLSAHLGIRANSFISFDQAFYRAEPRFSISWNPSDHINVRTSVNRLNQYLHLINNIALRLPNDLWIPSSKNIKPQASWQYELSFSQRLGNKIELTSEVYFRDFENIYAYPDDFALLNNIDLLNPEDYLTRGTGTSLGWETTLNYNAKQLGGFLSYSLADASRTYANQNQGLEYPFEYDHRHQFKFFIQKKWGNNLQASLQSIYFSPNPEISLTAVQSEQGLVNFDNNPEGQRNQLRGQAYFRIDFGLTYNIIKDYGRHSFQFGLFNLSDQDNRAFQRIEFDSNNQPIKLDVNSFPILPSFRYTFNIEF